MEVQDEKTKSIPTSLKSCSQWRVMLLVLKRHMNVINLRGRDETETEVTTKLSLT